MNKTLLIAGGILLLLILIMLWLAASVGPDTAPQEVQTIELTNPYDR